MSSPESTALAPNRPRVDVGAIVAVAFGLGYLVAHDGSAGWRVVRLVMVVALAALALLVVRGGSERGRAAVGFLGGVLATAIGVGIAAPHLAKTGLSPMTVAGLLCLAGGLVLIVGACIRVLRGSPRWRKVVVIASAVLSLFVATWTVGQAVAVTNVPHAELGDRTPADVGLTYEDVELRTSDGVRLSAWYVPATNGAAVVLAHGAGSTRDDVLDQAAVLAGHGYGVLLFDARGHGDSDGRAMDFGWYGDEDVMAAVDFLDADPGIEDRIAAVGMSMGGEEVIGAAAADERIRAVVAEGATNRVAKDKGWLSEEYGVRGWLQERIEWLTYAVTDVLTDADQPISLRDAVSAMAPRPVLLVTGGDVPDEALAGRYIQGGAPDSVELWDVPEAGHTEGVRVQPEEWEARVIGFLDAALAP